MQFYWLLLGVLSVWRVTHLFAAEDGPWDVVAWLRNKAGQSIIGRLLDCFYCLSLWIAVPFALLIAHGAKERVLLWLALSAGAILLERVATRLPAAPPALYWEEGEKNDVLRKEEAAADDDSAGRAH